MSNNENFYYTNIVVLLQFPVVFQHRKYEKYKDVKNK